jgi:hypothetical protein
VVHLADLMRVSQSRFEFFADRVMEPAAVYQVHDSVVDRGTTLRYVRSERKAYIDGAAYPSKDRSGRLDPIEEPHLGRLIAKCLGQTPSANPNTEHTN